jgi:NAD(P)-dependent dehydrogenase (short-subunit alcohol dehydrogenase family)
MDVCSDESVAEAVGEVIGQCESLDALVCNAGVGSFGSIEETSIRAAQEQFDTNYFGVLRMLRSVIPHMRGCGRGRIVLVGSLAGRAPIPFQSHYSASKAAVEATALALRNELHGSGIQVSLVEPGDINTAFNDATDFDESATSAYAERIRSAQRVIEESLPRAPGPEVVAATIQKALDARHPRTRYTVGPDAWLVPFGRRFLPDSLVLRLVRSHFRI